MTAVEEGVSILPRFQEANTIVCCQVVSGSQALLPPMPLLKESPVLPCVTNMPERPQPLPSASVTAAAPQQAHAAPAPYKPNSLPRSCLSVQHCFSACP